MLEAAAIAWLGPHVAAAVLVLGIGAAFLGMLLWTAHRTG